MGQGAPGVDQVRHHRPLRVQLCLLRGHLRPTPLRVILLFRRNVGLREVSVGRIDLPIHRVHGPWNFGALEIFLLKQNSQILCMLEARAIKYLRCLQIVADVE